MKARTTGKNKKRGRERKVKEKQRDGKYKEMNDI